MEEKSFNLKEIVFKNTSYQAVAHFFVLAIGLVSTAILSRYLGKEGFGQLHYVFSFFHFFLVLNDFGIGSILVREVSKNPKKGNEMIGSVLLFKIALAAFSVVAAWITILTVRFSDELRQILMIYALVLPLIALQLPAIIFQVVLKLEYPSVIGVISKAIGLVLVLGVVSMGYGIQGLVISLLINEVIYLLLLIKFARKYTQPVLRWDFEIVKKIVKPSLAMGTTLLFVGFVNRFDFIMLERLSSIADVGFYAAAYRITGLVETLPQMIMGSIFPLMSRYAKEDIQRLSRIYWKTTLGMGSLSIPIGLGVTFLSPMIVQTIYGAEFVDAAKGLSILVWASVCLYWALTGGNLLISLGHEKVNMVIQGFAMILNIILNFIWIPQFGFTGAAMATAITFFIIFVLTFVASSFYLKRAILVKESHG